jgi:hypothetical protein
MSFPTITLSPPPVAQSDEKASLFPIGNLKGRTVSLNWNDFNLSVSTERLLALAVGAFALTFFAVYKYCSEDEMLLPPHAFLEEQAKNGRFDGISFNQMEGYYRSQKRSLTGYGGRKVYREINQANLEFGRKALENHYGDPSKVALNACKTRHAARLLVRELISETYQKDAEYRDMLATGSKTGLTCSAIWDKYEGDPVKIVEASGRPNSDVNFLTRIMPEFIYCSIPENTRHAFISFYAKPFFKLF